MVPHLTVKLRAISIFRTPEAGLNGDENISRDTVL